MVERMKYIRTKDKIVERMLQIVVLDKDDYTKEIGILNCNGQVDDIISQADTIEELCDEMIIKYKTEDKPRLVELWKILINKEQTDAMLKEHVKWLKETYKDNLEICCLAIWVGAKLIPIAEFNEESEDFELI